MSIPENDPILVALRAAAAGDKAAQAEFWRLRRQRAVATRELDTTDTWADLDPATRSMVEQCARHRGR